MAWSGYLSHGFTVATVHCTTLHVPCTRKSLHYNAAHTFFSFSEQTEQWYINNNSNNNNNNNDDDGNVCWCAGLCSLRINKFSHFHHSLLFSIAMMTILTYVGFLLLPLPPLRVSLVSAATTEQQQQQQNKRLNDCLSTSVRRTYNLSTGANIACQVQQLMQRVCLLSGAQLVPTTVHCLDRRVYGALVHQHRGTIDVTANEMKLFHLILLEKTISRFCAPSAAAPQFCTCCRSDVESKVNIDNCHVRRR